jgi:cellulose synthase/poly-beta-1,6-N-acetylglucosamine synthase-like glycosyltransferase
MLLPAILDLDHAIFLLCLAFYGALGSSFFLSLFQYLRHRRQGMAEEARILALPLPADDCLPHILVQLPAFNEGALIRRVANAVGNLDWPRQLLHVQVLDDSTDGSIADSGRAAALLCERGIDAALLHRTDRQGFKAGALGEGLQQSDAPFVAILDADYLPRPDFLKSCMRALLHDRGLALVQARCDYLNGNENIVTRSQQRILDAHYAIEQPARSWSGQIVPFNGTCGIWRRAAIDEAGGWQGDTLAEDMDLSYRVQLRGWRTLFLTDVTVPGELPNDFQSWRRQQFRWTKGSAEVTRKLLASVWRSHLRFGQKLVSTLHLGGGLFGFLFGLTLISGLADFVFGTSQRGVIAILLFILAIEVIVGPALLQLVGQKYARGASMRSELRYLPLVTVLRLGMGLANLGGAAEALFGRGTAFVRTPKKGCVSDRISPSSSEPYAARPEP